MNQPDRDAKVTHGDLAARALARATRKLREAGIDINRLTENEKLLLQLGCVAGVDVVRSEVNEWIDKQMDGD